MSRSRYESMARGDLIDELCARDKLERLHSREAVENLQAELDRSRADADRLRTATNRVDSVRARYVDIFQGAPFGYCILDYRGVVLEANKAATAIFRVGPRGLVGRPLADFLTDGEEFAGHLERCFDYGRPSTMLVQQVYVVSIPIFPEDLARPLCKTCLIDVGPVLSGEVRPHVPQRTCAGGAR